MRIEWEKTCKPKPNRPQNKAIGPGPHPQGGPMVPYKVTSLKGSDGISRRRKSQLDSCQRHLKLNDKAPHFKREKVYHVADT